MTLVDANVLLHAVNSSSPAHRPAKRWLDRALSGGGPVELTWVVLLAFLRISTHPGIFPAPLPTALAMTQVEEWLSSPSARAVAPTSRHADVLRSLLEAVGTGGNLVTDAHLAALAIEHRVDIASFDRDFERFPGLRRIEPA